MAQINTEWDYGLKGEVFRVTGDKGYVHKTVTKLSKTSTANNTTLFDYFVAELKVNVDKDIGTSYINIYDNGKAIPFFISNTKYSQYEWTQNTTEKTITLRLGYDVEHNLQAKYHGNSSGLPSKSQTIQLYEDRPNVFKSTITRSNSTTQFNENTTISLPITYTSGGNAQSTHTKSIKFYCDGELKSTLTPTLSNGSATTTATASLSSISKGKHKIDFVFEADEYNAYTSLSFEIKVGYDIKILSKPEATVDCSDTTYQDHNSIVVQVKDYDDTPVTSASVTVYNNGSTSSKTTDSDGKITYVANSGATNFKVTYSSSSSEQITIPHFIPTETKVTTDTEYISRNSDNKVITEITEYSWKDDNEGTIEGIPIHISDSDGNDYVATLNENGVAEMDYHTDTDESEVTFSVQAGDVGNSETIKQVWQYWNATNKSAELNKKYLRLWHGDIIELANGYKFKPDNSLICRVGFGTGYDEGFGDYEITFNSRYSQVGVIIRGGGWIRPSSGIVFDCPSYTRKLYFAPYSAYKVKRVGSQLQVFRDDVIQFTSQVTTMGEPMLEFVFQNKADFVILNEITIKRL